MIVAYWIITLVFGFVMVAVLFSNRITATGFVVLAFSTIMTAIGAGLINTGSWTALINAFVG